MRPRWRWFFLESSPIPRTGERRSRQWWRLRKARWPTLCSSRSSIGSRRSPTSHLYRLSPIVSEGRGRLKNQSEAQVGRNRVPFQEGAFMPNSQNDFWKLHANEGFPLGVRCDTPGQPTLRSVAISVRRTWPPAWILILRHVESG